MEDGFGVVVVVVTVVVVVVEVVEVVVVVAAEVLDVDGIGILAPPLLVRAFCDGDAG